MLRHYCGRQSIGSTAPMASTFSLFFPLSHGQWPAEEAYDDRSSITSPSSASSSSSACSVDCTLSLGTPSSRLAVPEPKPGPACRAPPAPATVCWNAVAESHHRQEKPTVGPKGAADSGVPGPLLARCCANCGTTATPLWRNGPRGPKSLCNACGIRYKKEERRAAATATAESGGCGYTAQWGCYGPAMANRAVVYCDGAASPCGDAEGPFLAWRLSAAAQAAAPLAVWPERPSLYQYNY